MADIKKCATTVKPVNSLCLTYETGMEGHKVTVTGFQATEFSGVVKLRLLFADNPSNPVEVTFSRVDPATLRLCAAAIAGVLLLVVLGLVWQGIGYFHIEGQSYSPLTAFFLDEQTNSYSLSKLQLIVWTAVAVFAYVFVYLCHVLVQWDFTTPGIPDSWPTLLGFSAGTTVAAVGITATRGCKGAGPVQPSLADFVSTGGIVATDRFQYFVWTLVGGAGYLGLVLLRDPSTLTSLPEIPTGFLYLMGISSSGYLGGKLVRAPGPVISQLLVTGVAPVPGTSAFAMTIALKGDNLSTNATINVDGRDLRRDEVTITATKTQSGGADSSLCSELTVSLKDAGSYVEGQHTLTLTNRDGQFASSSFPLDPLAISPGQSFLHDTVKKTYPVNGNNFADGMTGEWIDANKVKTPVTAADIQIISKTQLQVSLTPGATPGDGTLILMSAIQLRAKGTVQVN